MKNIRFFSFLVILGLFLVAGTAMAASTIGTSISTAGTLTVGTDAAGTDVLFYTDATGEELLWDASENSLLLDGTDGATALNVTDGNVIFGDNLTVSGTSGVTLGNGATVVNTSATLLTVTENNITLAASATTTASGDVYVTKALKVGNGTPTVALANEAAYIEGALEVDGASNFGGLITAAGDVTLSNGATVVNTSATLLTVTENNITLAASATTTASGDVYVTKALKVGNGTPTVELANEAAYIEGALEVDGASNFGGTLTLQNAATLANTSATLLTITETNINLAGLVGVGTSTPATLVDIFSAATTTMKVDSNHASKGACLKYKDWDGTGYTYCRFKDGAETCNTVSCE